MAQGFSIFRVVLVAVRSPEMPKRGSPGTSFRHLLTPARRVVLFEVRLPIFFSRAPPAPDMDISKVSLRRPVLPGTSFRHLLTPARRVAFDGEVLCFSFRSCSRLHIQGFVSASVPPSLFIPAGGTRKLAIFGSSLNHQHGCLLESPPGRKGAGAVYVSVSAYVYF